VVVVFRLNHVGLQGVIHGLRKRGPFCAIHFGSGGTPCTLYSLQPINNLMDTLLAVYIDILDEPQWQHDHMIHLLPGTAPVAVLSYRYLQLFEG
jgi:hypothetical protein